MGFAASRARLMAQLNLGLDRTHINTQEQTQLITEPAQVSNESTTTGPDGVHNNAELDPTPLSRRERFSNSTKKALHIGQNPGHSSSNVVATAPILADAPDTTSDSRLVNSSPELEHHNLHNLCHNPINTLVSKAQSHGAHQYVSNLATKEISHGHEVELVRVHDSIQAARTQAQQLSAIRDRADMVAARQDMFVRWTMDRHISKVRILPRQAVAAQSRADFVTKENGREGVDWHAYSLYLAYHYAQEYGGEYIGFMGDPPTPDRDSFIPIVERILVASSPFQELVMAIRRIYRWENRTETLRYLLAYSILWVVNLVLPGILLSIIYFILRRKTHPPTIEDIRKGIMRTEDMNETPLTLTEFIEKEGAQKWLDALLERLGPWALLQLSDAANLMEIIQNFYEWRDPGRTVRSLGIFLVGLVIAILTPVWLIVRATTLVIGIVFFCLFPIASRFPDYRLIACPVQWIFWKVPTHAEWAIKVLQAKGAGYREETSSSEKKPNRVDPLNKVSDLPDNRDVPEVDGNVDRSKPTPDKDYGSYKCRGGKLVVTSTGIRFDSSFGHSGSWSLPYGDVTRLEKATRQVQKVIGKDSGEDLKITGPGNQEYLLLNVAKRNEAFAQVVGFSDVTWQVVW